MVGIRSRYSHEITFYKDHDPVDLIEEFGSPLYVYCEDILRRQCRKIKTFLSYPDFRVSYSTKANSNIQLLKIIRDEGLYADAMSPGEITALLKAGFAGKEIFFVSNNVSSDELIFANERNITVSVDSLSQLNLFGNLFPGKDVAIRINPGIGAGHHKKVITGGASTKFGIALTDIESVHKILVNHQLRLIGINQHIGSFFKDPEPYLAAVKALLACAENFSNLEFIDFGGGFGIPYVKQNGTEVYSINNLGRQIDKILFEWADKTGWNGTFKIEPGRFVAAECGILLGTVNSMKTLYGTKYAGTDIGFNVLSRPILYDAFHDVEIYRRSSRKSSFDEEVTIVGNICETGDIVASQRILPELFEGDVIGILDTGAYGFTMSSNYNLRPRPAEVLIKSSGSLQIIRERENLEDIL